MKIFPLLLVGCGLFGAPAFADSEKPSETPPTREYTVPDPAKQPPLSGSDVCGGEYTETTQYKVWIMKGRDGKEYPATISAYTARRYKNTAFLEQRSTKVTFAPFQSQGRYFLTSFNYARLALCEFTEEYERDVVGSPQNAPGVIQIMHSTNLDKLEKLANGKRSYAERNHNFSLKKYTSTQLSLYDFTKAKDDQGRIDLAKVFMSGMELQHGVLIDDQSYGMVYHAEPTMAYAQNQFTYESKRGKRVDLYPNSPVPAGVQRFQWMPLAGARYYSVWDYGTSPLIWGLTMTHTKALTEDQLRKPSTRAQKTKLETVHYGVTDVNNTSGTPETYSYSNVLHNDMSGPGSNSYPLTDSQKYEDVRSLIIADMESWKAIDTSGMGTTGWKGFNPIQPAASEALKH